MNLSTSSEWKETTVKDSGCSYISICKDPSAIEKPQSLLVFVHAAGFCKEIWLPIIRILQGSVYNLHFLSIDLKSHGDAEKYKLPLHMTYLRDGVLKSLEHFSKTYPLMQFSRVVGIGHSLGGTTLLYVEESRKMFNKLFLVEPIVRCNPTDTFLKAATSPFSEMTLRRKSWFGSRQEAIANWQAKPPFSSWDTYTLEVYAKYGLAHNSHDNMYHLKCTVEDEADVYTTAQAIRDRLGCISCPVELVVGKDSMHVGVAYAESLLARMGNPCRFVLVPGTHFVPMETPHLIAGHIRTSLSGIVSRL
mmetsp:Transcript_40904/g.65712  ORF Transcript_40904/g.65712 Transcript_40904/m.65712 type:complete len:305 (-) Transcript_40904:2486-3400(-)